LSEAKIKLLSAILSLLGITIAGTLGLAYLENWTLFDALWVTTISLTTTGYGDIVPATPAGRFYLLLVLIMGVGVVAYSLGAVTNTFLERQINLIMDKSKKYKYMKNLENHTIICGAGRVGSNVAAVLKAENAPYILVDTNPEVVERMEEAGHPIVLGDPNEDEVLLNLGINKAAGIISALPDDAHNLFITVTARSFNPKIKIVSRSEKPETIKKLLRAGADKVIAPTLIAGSQMARAMLKPLTVGLIDTLYTSTNEHINIEEFFITLGSALIGKDIVTLLSNQNKVAIIAIIRDSEFMINVRGNTIIHEGDTLVLIGSREYLDKLEADYANPL